MITGFGNNVVSSLASDITAGQTTILVMPGAGSLFEGLLSSDYENPSNSLSTYAKLTLTDSKETSFEVCHLISVSNDVLTVIRGQEGTTAKGWSLNDVIANFATRGSENQFVQIDHLQSGFYCAGVADGSANALMLHLPSSFFLNGSTDWMLRTPVIVYPTQDNTGAATLQLVLGGVAIGTFPLYKGNKAELVAGDIIKDVALVCLLDISKSFFNVSNPGAIYAGLGTAAFHDVQTSKDDVTAGRVLVNGGALALRTVMAGAGRAVTDFDGLPANSVSFGYSDATHSPGFTGSVLDFSGSSGRYNAQIATEYNEGGKHIAFRTHNGDSEGAWNNWFEFYHTGNKPTAADVGAMPYFGTALNVDLNTLGAYSAAGVHYQPSSAGATTANHYPVAEAGTLMVTPSAYGCQQEYTTFGDGRTFSRGLSGPWNGTNGPWGNWNELYGPTNPNEIVSPSANSFRIAYNGYGTFWRNDGINFYLMLTNSGDPHGNYNALRPFRVSVATGEAVMHKLNLEDFSYFDARYLQTLNLSNTGAVGTLALLCHDTALGLGATAAGSSLYYSGFGAQKDSYGDHATVGRLTSPQPAGTWKCMGIVPAPNNNDRGASLFCRIA